MEGYEDVQFEQRATIEFLTAEKFLPSTFIAICKVYADKCVDVGTIRCSVQEFQQDGGGGEASLCDREGSDCYRQVS
jgi:hypothetical protein